MARRLVFLAIGVVLASAAGVLAWHDAPDDPVAIALPVTTAPPVAIVVQAPPPGLPATATAPPARPAPLAVALAASAPAALRVGELADLVVGLGVAPEVGAVGFTVRVDGEVLQVRSGAEGDWSVATGTTARFEADLSSTDDRIRVRSALVSPRPATGPASIALVQFQAIAPGTASVMISDVTVTDRDGRTLPFTLAPTTLQVTATSAAPPP